MRSNADDLKLAYHIRPIKKQDVDGDRHHIRPIKKQELVGDGHHIRPIKKQEMDGDTVTDILSPIVTASAGD